MNDPLLRANAVTALVLLLAAPVWIGGEAEAQSTGFVLIAHPDLGQRSVTKKQVSDIFLKKLGRIEGVEIRAVDLAGDLPVREAFSRAIHGREVAAVKSYWQRQIFSGRSAPPPERENEDEVLEFVRTTPGGIGYVAATADTSGLVILEIED